MSATISFSLPTYPLAQILSKVFVRTDHFAAGTEFAGPAEFEIPDEATLELRSASQIIIVFNYSDHESAEPTDRLGAADGTVIARLAVQTKKILRLQFSGNLEHHFRSHFHFDRDVLSLSGRAPIAARALRSFERNADVVARLLDAIPSQIYDDLGEEIRLMKERSSIADD